MPGTIHYFYKGKEQFNVWFLGDIKYIWLDKIAYPIYCTIHRKPSG